MWTVQYLLQLFPNWVSSFFMALLGLTGADDGLRYRARFGLPFESSCVLRSVGSGVVSGFRNCCHIIHRSGDRWVAAAGVTVRRRERKKAGFDLSSGFAFERHADIRLVGISLIACFVAEVVLTFLFPDDHHGATTSVHSRFAPIADRLGLP